MQEQQHQSDASGVSHAGAKGVMAPVTAEQIERAFTYHAPKGNQAERYQHLRDVAKELASEIARLSPPGREQAIALANLEQAVMWANAAIARGE